MLKGIPAVLSPELMSVMMSMGHGDEIVLADGNFPADSHAKRLVRADGLTGPTMLEAVLQFLPLDTFVKSPAFVMQPVDPEGERPPIWKTYESLIEKAEQRSISLVTIERFAFYERALNAYAIMATSETALYANLILKKGVVEPAD